LSPAATIAETAPPGVTYFDLVAGGEAVRMFRCEPHQASLTPGGCGKRWTAAQGGGHLSRRASQASEHLEAVKTKVRANEHGRWQHGARRQIALASDRIEAVRDSAEALDVCRGCPIGAAHAGAQHIHYSTLFGQEICPRCRRGGLRMIRNRLCVSCYNRRREIRAGRNGRGNRPTELLQRPPKAREFRLIIDGVARRHRDEGVDLFEPMVQALRVNKGRIAFAFQGSTAGLRQGRLF
jgi:hypothetical protein